MKNDNEVIDPIKLIIINRNESVACTCGATIGRAKNRKIHMKCINIHHLKILRNHISQNIDNSQVIPVPISPKVIIKQQKSGNDTFLTRFHHIMSYVVTLALNSVLPKVNFSRETISYLYFKPHKTAIKLFSSECIGSLLK